MDFENLSFSEKLDIKNLRDDVYALSNVLPDKFHGRRLNHIILMNDSIREYITNFKLNTAEFHNSLIDILRRFKKFANSSSEDFITLLTEYENFAKNFNEFAQKKQDRADYNFGTMPLISNTILSLIGNVKDCVRRCDRLYDCAQTAYKVESQSEPKYTKATAETIVKTFLAEDSFYGESNNDKFDKLDLSDNKIVCKNIKAVKNDMISIVNKYFGKNSEFGALDIMNKII